MREFRIDFLLRAKQNQNTIACSYAWAENIVLIKEIQVGRASQTCAYGGYRACLVH